MPRVETVVGTLAAVVLIGTVAGSVNAQRPKPKETEVRGHTMYTLLKPGDIPAIFEPEFIPARKADSLYYPDEPLIAIAEGRTAKAYSIWHLDHHEVVNDHINGKAIAVTW